MKKVFSKVMTKRWWLYLLIAIFSLAILSTGAYLVLPYGSFPENMPYVFKFLCSFLAVLFVPMFLWLFIDVICTIVSMIREKSKSKNIRRK